MKEDILHSALKEVQMIGDFKSHKAEIDAEDMSWILQILSTNLYSDPVGSLIREYSSNAWDANVEAGNRDKPIEVGIQTTPDKGTYWYVTDLGPGLSPERIDTVYRKFGKSTKRASNEAIGMMGLGKFSGLSYTNEVFISTRVNGMQYEYLMHKSEGVPQIDLLLTKLTDLPNGTTIKINLKNHWSERREFVQKTLEQLAYFENVYFNIDDKPEVNKDFYMIQGKTFTYSSLESRDLRIKIGPVSYPIDHDALKNADLRSAADNLKGIAINFKIGEIAITPNRESILYNKATLDNIHKRVAEFTKEITDLYDTQVLEYELPKDFFKAKEGKYINLEHKGNGKKRRFNVIDLVKSPRRNPSLKGLDIPYLSTNLSNMDILLYGYKHVYNINNNRKTDQNYNRSFPYIDERQDILLLGTHSLEPKHTKYLSEKKGNSSWRVVQKHRFVKLRAKDSSPSYYTILGLSKVPKKDWRDTIKKFQAWQDAYMKKYCVQYDDYVPTKEWLKAQRDATKLGKTADFKSLRKSQGKILVKEPEKSYGYHNSCTFKAKDWLIKNLDAVKKYVIYGTEDDKDILSNLWYFTKLNKETFHRIQVIITAKANHKYLELLPNYVNVHKFMKGDSKYFARIVSLHRLYRTHEIAKTNIYKYKELFFQLDQKIYDAVDKIQEIMKDYESTLPMRYGNNESVIKLMESMEATAAEHNLYDWELEAQHKELLAYMDKYDFLRHVAFTQISTYQTARPHKVIDRSYSKEQIEFAVFVCKAKKVKIDTKHYQHDTRIEGTTEEEEEVDTLAF